MKNYEAIFAANLKRLRKERGITQKELAEAVGYSEKTVSKWECSSSIPDIAGLFAVGKALQVSVEELFHDGEEVYFLGIDGGGTKTALVLADAGGNVMRTLRTKNCNPFDIGIDACKEVLGNAIREICGNIPTSCIVTFAGIAGGSSGNMKPLLKEFLQSFHFRMCDNDSDNLNLLEAGLGDEDGMALILGTGVCGWARLNREYYRAAGWGYLIDEGGSAYNLGQEALRAYYNAVDGIGSWSPLSEAVRELYPQGHQALLPEIYSGGKKFIASFARLVFEAAQKGDSMAEAILRRNMEAAARIVEAAGTRFEGRTQAIPVILSGGLTNQPVVMEYLKEALREPQRYELRILDKEPVYGALDLAKRLFAEQSRPA